MTNLARSFVLVCIIFFILLFLSYRLGFLDEDNWVTNGRLFFQALKSFNLSSTYIGSDAQHPGVSILWLSILSQVIIQNLKVFFGK